MARNFDVAVMVAPGLRSAFEGRRELSLGMPAHSDIGDVVETLLRLYPRARQYVVGDRDGSAQGPYLHLALDERSRQELARGGGGLSAGLKLYVFALSRAPQGWRAGVEG
ncbi:MAG TPA: hypothetical protein VE153_09290 [Myxococcus sp.]|nr:hypothetical protein [Myxococcus sp.]